MDRLSPERRSALMAKVGSKNTVPEMRVRKVAHALGYRFRLHRKDLPGKPDLVFPGRRKIIFVHGCFWHRHEDCAKASHPATRQEFWSDKFARNVARYSEVILELERLGWAVMVIWECETKSNEALIRLITEFLGG